MKPIKWIKRRRIHNFRTTKTRRTPIYMFEFDGALSVRSRIRKRKAWVRNLDRIFFGTNRLYCSRTLDLGRNPLWDFHIKSIHVR